ncbi:7348_t:CDS:2, partial [Funneliformis mosseae]
VVLVTQGNNTLSSEYPTVKQISLGHIFKIDDLKEIRESIFEKLNIKPMVFLQKMALRLYDDNFETYKKAAKDYDIDLFFCDLMVNDACVDAANVLNKPVVGFTSFLLALAPNTYKSDPIFGCNVSLENASFLERFRCTIISPLQTIYQLNVKEKLKGYSFMAKDRLPKASLLLVNTYFGFELPQSLPPNIREIGP